MKSEFKGQVEYFNSDSQTNKVCKQLQNINYTTLN